MFTSCPRCGGELRVTEVGIMAAESPQPTDWRTVSRRCARGCKLVAGEVPEDAA